MTTDKSEFAVRPWNDPFLLQFIRVGELDISIAENAKNSISHHRKILTHAIRNFHSDGDLHFDLEGLSPIEIDIPTFHGHHYCCRRKILVTHRRFETSSGVQFQECAFVGCPSNEEYVQNVAPFTLGNFAYAFCFPPGGGGGKPRLEIQNLYTYIVSQLLPRPDVTIYNWHQEKILEALPQLSDISRLWGVFAFTIFIPGTNRIFGIFGTADYW